MSPISKSAKELKTGKKIKKIKAKTNKIKL